MGSARYLVTGAAGFIDSHVALSLARQLLGYEPSIGFREGLACTVEALCAESIPAARAG